MTENWQRIFALSIDDEVTWATALANCVTNADIKSAYGIRHDTLGKLEKNDCPQTVIHKRLMDLKKSDADLREAFNNTVAVGISTLGVVDRGEPRKPADSYPRLVSIARKSTSATWQKASSNEMLDFRPLLDMFGNGSLRIAAENNATAYCLVEYQNLDMDAQKEAKVLCYVLLGDGVNVGFLINGATPDLPLHPEAGHLIPSRYEHDLHFDPKKHSGCSLHGNCFEGLASNVRFTRQWGKPLQRLPRDTGLGSPLDILSAYAAGMAWAAACAIAPDRFMIGGPMAVEELIPLIRTKFDRLNSGYLPQYPVGKNGAESFIQPAKIKQNQGILGGLEIARRAASRPGRPSLVPRPGV